MVFGDQTQFEYGADIVLSPGSRWVVCALLCLGDPNIALGGGGGGTGARRRGEGLEKWASVPGPLLYV